MVVASILILVRQSPAFCKFIGRGRDLISLLNFLLQHCRSPCSTTNTFWLFFFINLFSLVYLIIIGLVFHWKNVNRHLFSVKSFENQLGVIFRLTHHISFIPWLLFLLQCNATLDEIRVMTSEKKQKLINTNVITKHDTIAMSCVCDEQSWSSSFSLFQTC